MEKNGITAKPNKRTGSAIGKSRAIRDVGQTSKAGSEKWNAEDKDIVAEARCGTIKS
jgi:hypothetical protein